MPGPTTPLRRRLARLLRPVAAPYAAAAAALGLATVAGYAAPLAVAMGVDVATGAAAGGPERTATPGWLAPVGALLDGLEPRTALWAAAGAALVLTLVGGALQYLRGRWVGQASERVAKGLRDALHAHLMRLPRATLDAHEQGDLVQRCTSDVETVRTFVAAQLPEVARAAVMLAVALPLLVSLDPTYAAVSVALYPLIVALALFFFRGVRGLFREVDESEGRLTSVVQENLAGVRVVRAFAAREHELAKFAAANADFRDRTRRWIERLGDYWSTSDLLCMGQMLLVLAFGAHQVRSGTLSVGLFFTFVTTSGLTIWPVRQIGRVLTDLGRASVALDRVFEVLDAEPERGGDVPAGRARRIEVRGLVFGYGAAPPVLSGVDLVLEPGRTVALVGPPGAGKSSLVEALLATHPYRGGSILVDGRELSGLDPAWVRAQVALVSQRPFLFSRTIADNLRVANAEAEAHDLERVCRQASIHGSVVGFEDGYATAIGERGVDLSGGQRQRLSIARALLEDAPFLVLDDALSAVDTATERDILDALASESGRRGVLLVTHRLSGAVRADEIVVLERGRVVERGTHRELLAAGGHYARLWDEQAAERTAGGTA